MDVIPLNYVECLKDSPLHRQSVRINEKILQQSYQRIKALQDQFGVIQNTYKKLSKDFDLLYEIVLSVNDCVFDNDSMKECLQKAAKIYKEHSESLKSLHPDVENACTDIEFFTQEMKLMPEKQRTVRHTCEQWELAQIKAVNISPVKIDDCREADQLCHESRDNFRNESNSYLYFLKSLYIRRNLQTMKSQLKFVNCHKVYFKNMNEFFENVNPWITYLSTQVDYLNEQSIFVKDKVDNPVQIDTLARLKSNNNLSGHLYKRKSWRQWARKWFQIDNNQLIGFSRNTSHASSELKYHVLEKDLSICTARIPDVGSVGDKRRFCFELVTPTGSHYFQAFSETEFNQWLDILKLGMSNRLNRLSNVFPSTSREDGPHPRFSVPHNNEVESTNQHYMTQEIEFKSSSCVVLIRKVSGNDRCCDCNAVDPRWTASNLGITLCEACSGIHRSFGVQVSKVRSLALDHWDPAAMRLMLALGNEEVNRIVLANKASIKLAQAEGIQPPLCLTIGEMSSTIDGDRNQFSDQSDRRKWLTAKWIEKRFLSDAPVVETDEERMIGSTVQLWHSLLTRKVSTMLESMFNGANLNGTMMSYLTFSDSGRKLRSRLCRKYGEEETVSDTIGVCLDDKVTPLMCASSRSSLAITEFLLANGAKVDARDSIGRSALHYAIQHDRTQQVCHLLKRRADQDVKDDTGETPLTLALMKKHADIVTLLRVRLLKDVSVQDTDAMHNEVINDVFRDFTYRAFEESSSGSSDDQDFESNIQFYPSGNLSPEAAHLDTESFDASGLKFSKF